MSLIVLIPNHWLSFYFSKAVNSRAVSWRRLIFYLKHFSSEITRAILIFSDETTGPLQELT